MNFQGGERQGQPQSQQAGRYGYPDAGGEQPFATVGFRFSGGDEGGQGEAGQPVKPDFLVLTAEMPNHIDVITGAQGPLRIDQVAVLSVKRSPQIPVHLTLVDFRVNGGNSTCIPDLETLTPVARLQGSQPGIAVRVPVAFLQSIPVEHGGRAGIGRRAGAKGIGYRGFNQVGPV